MHCLCGKEVDPAYASLLIVAFYKPEIAEEMQLRMLRTLERSFDLVSNYTFRRYQSEQGSEYATHGFGRRLRTLDHCLRGVFEILPPDMAPLPTRDEAQEATVLLQVFYINLYGAFDNLAHLWVAERNVMIGDRPFGRREIGFAPKYAALRRTLPDHIQCKLTEYDGWFGYVEDFRHALAHRIPLYIADRAYTPSDAEAFSRIQDQKRQAYQDRDFDKLDALMDEQAELGTFNSLVMHSFGERARPVQFHPQMIIDHSTVVEFAELFLNELP
jgi:hypothetical protein